MSSPARRGSNRLPFGLAAAFGLLVVGCRTGGDAPAPDGSNAVGDARHADAATSVELDAASTTDGGARAPTVRLPPVDGLLDYQLGGAYPPPAGVNVVSRDRQDAPAPGLYNVCYINGFQVQPGEEDLWDPDLLLRDADGNPIIDPDWDEVLIDVTDEDKRDRVAAVVGGWIDACGDAGFDAIEIDNLDTYSRSGSRITEDDAVLLLRLLSDRAHAHGLAIAQKNATELLPRRTEMGTDFAVSEECSRYSECGDYVDAYGAGVLMIEYRAQDFAAGCASFGATHAIVRRDLGLAPVGAPGYVYDGC